MKFNYKKITVDVTEKLNGKLPKSCSECPFATSVKHLDVCYCGECPYWNSEESCIICEFTFWDVNDCYWGKPEWCPLKTVE